MSKSSRLSRDLSACIATRQIGQWRMVGRRDVVIENTSSESTVRPLIQINADAGPTAAASRSFVRANDLDQGATRRARQALAMWQPASNAPFDCDLELAVIDGDGQHALVFPCRRISAGWINASTRERLDVRPTHWRPWADKR